MSESVVHLLLIEDNTQHLALLRQMLANSDTHQFQLDQHVTLAEGLARIGEYPVDLILLDLDLPDSRGLETFLTAYRVAGEIPIIVLTGLDDEALAVETVRLGAQDYLVKSQISSQWLARSIQYALERKRAQFELKRANDELERRVAERTTELQNMNGNYEREIAERKRAEEALRESNRQLAEALSQLKATQQHVIQRERLNALGRMASGIAHDFNNALAPIVGFSELLLVQPDTLADQEKARSYLQMIHTAAKESANVVGRLREFYRYRDESEVFGSVSMNEIVREAINLTQPKWKDQALAKGTEIKIVTEFQELPAILGNDVELREMLTNIILNSADSFRESGTIRFSTFVKDHSVVVRIEDTGAGMTPEVLARCMEPFYSTKPESRTGLGLGIVYGIIRRHEGEIDIQSAPGAGTTVTVSLPFVHDEQPEPEPAAGPVQTASRALRILVVEDEPLVRDVVTVYLQEDGHQIETAENGRIGVEKFAPGKFDLVLTDRAMPEMNGDQCAAAIKKMDPAIPVILLTGFGDLMSGAGERPEGIDLVVSKPFTMNSLRDAIMKAVSGTPNQ